MAKLMLVATICAAIPLPTYAQPSGGTVAGAIAGAVSDPDEAARLSRSGFEPLAKIAKEKRTLRRVSYLDPFNTGAMPGVSIEKLPSGDVTLSLTANHGKAKEVVKISQDDWNSLVKLDREAFMRPKNRMTPAEAKLICHSDSIVIEIADAGKTRRRDASHCKKDTEAMLYGYAVAAIAVENIPYCREYKAPDREPSAQLTECFREKAYDSN